jgi:hypothetical protein
MQEFLDAFYGSKRSGDKGEIASANLSSAYFEGRIKICFECSDILLHRMIFHASNAGWIGRTMP